MKSADQVAKDGVKSQQVDRVTGRHAGQHADPMTKTHRFDAYKRAFFAIFSYFFFLFSFFFWFFRKRGSNLSLDSDDRSRRAPPCSGEVFDSI